MGTYWDLFNAFWNARRSPYHVDLGCVNKLDLFPSTYSFNCVPTPQIKVCNSFRSGVQRILQSMGSNVWRVVSCRALCKVKIIRPSKFAFPCIWCCNAPSAFPCLFTTTLCFCIYMYETISINLDKIGVSLCYLPIPTMKPIFNVLHQEPLHNYLPNGDRSIT